MVSRTISVLAADFEWQRISVRAAALTYVTIFSLVPMFAVGFATFNAFGGLDRAQDILIPRILDYVAPASRGEVQQRIGEFVRNIHGGAIGGVGIVFLILSAISLLGGLEDAFNEIWGARKRRTFLQRLTTYWTVVSVTPLLLLAAVGLRPALRRIEPLEWALQASGLSHLLFSLILPLALVCVAFALTYAIVPNTRVPMRYAAVGGAVAGTAWFAAAAAYAWYATAAVSYSKIYGSLGAALIFLLWIYLTWIVVLFGAHLAAAFEQASGRGPAVWTRAASRKVHDLVALRVMYELSRRFIEGGRGATLADLAHGLPSPPRLLKQVLERLVDLHLVVESGEPRTFLPACDPHRTSPGDVLRLLHQPGMEGTWGPDDRGLQRLRTLVEEGDRAALAEWSRMSFADLLLAPEEVAG